MSARETVVLTVVADPEPQNASLHINAEGPMMETNSTGPESPHALEAKRRVARVGLEKLILLICQLLNWLLQVAVAGPKLQGGEVPQNSVDFPAA
jgi:hypothetical protein